MVNGTFVQLNPLPQPNLYMESQSNLIESLQVELAELRKAYHELQIKEERYRLLTEHARDVIWTQKLDGTITYLSPAVTILRGLTVEEAMVQPVDKILTPESLMKVVMYLQEQYTLFTAGLPLKSFRGELDYYRKDGSILSTEVITYPITGNTLDEVIILGVTREITERKEFEAQLLAQAKELKALNATKDKFFSIIAHDLKNPLVTILGYSELLKSDAAESGTDWAASYANTIYSSTKHTYELLENLLDWAKTQQNSFPFSPDSFSLNELISNELDRLKAHADQKNIALINQASEEIPVFADEKMISTVLRNLLSNALKFTPKDGKVSVHAAPKGDQVEISVMDTGVGIDKKVIKKLFKINNGFTTRGTENEKGTGLGLILCKEFVEKHGGEIAVESQPEKGSRFYFSIPFSQQN